MIQLDRSGQQKTLEYRIVDQFMEALGKRRIPEIARGTGQSVDEVQEALERIGRLEPGRAAPSCQTTTNTSCGSLRTEVRG